MSARSTLKKRKQQEAAAQEQLEFMEELLGTIKTHPEKWASSRLLFLREFVNYVFEHQVEFPPALPSAADDDGQVASNQADLPLDAPTLTCGFGAGLADESIVSTDSCTNDPPVLQVVNVQTKATDISDVSEQADTNRSFIQRITSLTVVDGDGRLILVKLASQLSDVFYRLREGVVFRATSFRALYWEPGEDSTRSVAVLLCNFSVVGTFPVGRLIDPGEPLTVQVESKSEGSADVFRSVAQGASNNVVCQHGNRLCSTEQVVFDCCICDAIPPESLELTEVSRECWFLDVADVTLLPNRKK
jgi:hypothetical protein